MTSALSFLFTISLVVIFHEYGHYYVARKMGYKINEFSIGFGKKFCGFKDSIGTLWSLRIILLGGFVKIDFSADSSNNISCRKKAIKQMFVAFGGPLANFILAILILWIIYLYEGRYDFIDIWDVRILLVNAFLHSLSDVVLTSYAILKGFLMIFTEVANLKHLGGVITIANHSSAALGYGVLTYLKFLAMLSINLGILNLLPIPVLDGGRILLLFYELLTGKVLNQAAKEKLYKVGMYILLFLIVISLSNDIKNLLY